MSLIARCPACSTMFKVVPDQLRVSQGWVRCGQCNEVFDANAHSQLGAADSRANAVSKEAEPAAPLVPFAVVDAAFHVETADKEGSVEAASTESFLEANPHALPIDSQDNLKELAEPDALLEPVGPVVVVPSALVNDNAQPVGSDPAYLFMRKNQMPSQWNRPPVRVALAVFAALLGLMLCLQVAVQERNRIAAADPHAKGILESLCLMVSCKISPLLQIESIVIDSSSFAKTWADVYRLSFTLKNIAPVPVATPALELTLTDMLDQAVVRRVFTTIDFGGGQSIIGPGAELIVTIPMEVKLTANREKISGYRLLSFYP